MHADRRSERNLVDQHRCPRRGAHRCLPESTLLARSRKPHRLRFGIARAFVLSLITESKFRAHTPEFEEVPEQKNLAAREGQNKDAGIRHF